VSPAIDWLNVNAGAVQALATIVLVIITIVYAVLTRQIATSARVQTEILRRASAPDVSVSFSWGFRMPGRTAVAVLSAANEGQAVTLTQPSLQLPDNRTLVFPDGFDYQDVHFPVRLETGNGCQAHVHMANIVEGLVRAGFQETAEIRVVFCDQAGREYISKAVTIEIPTWARRPPDDAT
jgi:hypothetical protein